MMLPASPYRSTGASHAVTWLATGMLALALLGGCSHQAAQNAATPKPATDISDGDKLENINRPLYKFNYVLDQGILRPVTVGYRAVVPQQGRIMVSNFLTNLYSPVVFANSVLQGDPQNSFATLWRFIINSTLGVGGLFDFAGNQVKLYNRPADFGETLAFYNVTSGPYLFLPILGPSDMRDAVGALADAFINPLAYISTPADYASWGLTAVDVRSKRMQIIDDTYANSLDPYATFRSIYTQKRAADIKRALASRNAALEKQQQDNAAPAYRAHP